MRNTIKNTIKKGAIALSLVGALAGCKPEVETFSVVPKKVSLNISTKMLGDRTYKESDMLEVLADFDGVERNAFVLLDSREQSLPAYHALNDELNDGDQEQVQLTGRIYPERPRSFYLVGATVGDQFFDLSED
jgi:hypothetical protein